MVDGLEEDLDPIARLVCDARGRAAAVRTALQAAAAALPPAPGERGKGFAATAAAAWGYAEGRLQGDPALAAMVRTVLERRCAAARMEIATERLVAAACQPDAAVDHPRVWSAVHLAVALRRGRVLPARPAAADLEPVVRRARLPPTPRGGGSLVTVEVAEALGTIIATCTAPDLIDGQRRRLLALPHGDVLDLVLFGHLLAAAGLARSRWALPTDPAAAAADAGPEVAAMVDACAAVRRDLAAGIAATLQRVRSAGPVRLLDLVVERPILTAADVAGELAIDASAARRLLDRLADRGVVRRFGRRSVPQRWVADRVVAL